MSKKKKKGFGLEDCIIPKLSTCEFPNTKGTITHDNDFSAKLDKRESHNVVMPSTGSVNSTQLNSCRGITPRSSPLFTLLCFFQSNSSHSSTVHTPLFLPETSESHSMIFPKSRNDGMLLSHTSSPFHYSHNTNTLIAPPVYGHKCHITEQIAPSGAEHGVAGGLFTGNPNSVSCESGYKPNQTKPKTMETRKEKTNDYTSFPATRVPTSKTNDCAGRRSCEKMRRRACHATGETRFSQHASAPSACIRSKNDATLK